MSNPLLRPGDPRFQKPTVVDASGANRFAEAPEVAEAEGANGDLYSAGGSLDKPYQPEYETTARPRGGLLLVLASFGLAGAATTVVSMTGVLVMGWILPLCTLPMSAAAVYLALEELKLMKLGAMEDSGRTTTRLALWIGLVGVAASLLTIAAMIWMGLSFLPDVL